MNMSTWFRRERRIETMFERLDELRANLPNPTLDDKSWEEVRDQHERNARRLRAEAYRCLMVAAGQGILTLRRTMAKPYGDHERSRSAAQGHHEPEASVQS